MTTLYKSIGIRRFIYSILFAMHASMSLGDDRKIIQPFENWRSAVANVLVVKTDNGLPLVAMAETHASQLAQALGPVKSDQTSPKNSRTILYLNEALLAGKNRRDVMLYAL